MISEILSLISTGGAWAYPRSVSLDASYQKEQEYVSFRGKDLNGF